HDTDDTADLAQHNGFHDELRHDVPFFGADGPAHPDLPRPFRHGNEHDVHDTDAGGDERDGTDHHHAHAHGPGKRVELFNQRIVGEQLEIVRGTRPDLAGRAQDAAH